MPIAPLNRIFRDHGHLYAYDAEAMISALTSAGFAQTEKTSFMKGRDPKLLVDSEERAVESLYVEEPPSFSSRSNGSIQARSPPASACAM